MSHVTLSVSQRMMLRVVQRMHRLVALSTPRPFASAARNFTSKSHGNLDERLRSLLSSGEAVEGSELQQKLHRLARAYAKGFDLKLLLTSGWPRN